MTVMKIKAPNVVLTLSLLGLTPAASQGAPPPPSDAPVAATATLDIDPRALALLERVQARMGAIRSLTASSRETITHLATKAKPQERSLIEITQLRLMRPNLTRAERIWESRPASSDPASASTVETFAAAGRTSWRLWKNTNELTTWPTDPTGEDSEKSLPGPLRGFFDRKLLPTAFIAALENEHLVRRLRLLGTQTWKGRPYQVVQLEYQKAGSSDIETDDDFIGRDFLIHHLTCAWGTTRVQADLSDLRIDPPLTPASFAYTPPAAAKVHLSESTEPASALAPGTLAPDFTLKTADGAPVHLAGLRGKVVVLDFWATWCGNCLQEFPGDSALAQKYAAQGVLVLAVDVCDAPDVYRRWLAKHPDFKALVFALDPQGIHGKGINTTLYQGASLPEQYVIDRTGHLTAAISGYDGDAKETMLEAAIKKACGP